VSARRDVEDLGRKSTGCPEMAVARFGRRTGSRRSSGGSRCGWGWHRACFWNGCGKSHDRLATSWNGPLRAAALAWRTEPATILDRAGRTGLTRCFLQTGPADFHGPPGFSFQGSSQSPVASSQMGGRRGDEAGHWQLSRGEAWDLNLQTSNSGPTHATSPGGTLAGSLTACGCIDGWRGC